MYAIFAYITGMYGIHGVFGICWDAIDNVYFLHCEQDNLLYTSHVEW